VERFEANPQVKIIVMDIRMPEMDGIEATAHIRKTNQEVKILGLSMMDDRANIVNMFKAGANGYLLKNTNKLELLEAFQSMLAGKNYYAKEVAEVFLLKEFSNSTALKKKNINNEITTREEDILRLICQQYSTREISEILCLSEKTIEGHRKKLLDKTHSRNIAGLVWFALENGIIKEAKG
jgi:DNA-binding NarL/FixJ family response regulator